MALFGLGMMMLEASNYLNNMGITDKDLRDKMMQAYIAGIWRRGLKEREGQK